MIVDEVRLQVLGWMLPSEGFAYFSGQDGKNKGWYPCLYFYYAEGPMWVVMGPPDIKIETRSFRKAVREYKKHFVGKTAGQAALAVMQGTSLCRCHKSKSS